MIGQAFKIRDSLRQDVLWLWLPPHRTDQETVLMNPASDRGPDSTPPQSGRQEAEGKGRRALERRSCPPTQPRGVGCAGAEQGPRLPPCWQAPCSPGVCSFSLCKRESYLSLSCLSPCGGCGCQLQTVASVSTRALH